MEIRKVQVTGGASYAITLPKSWVKKHNLKKNDSIRILIQPDGALQIFPIKNQKIQNAINIKETNDKNYLFRLLVASYIRGYSVIVIEGKDRIQPVARESVKKFTQIAIGLEIIEEKKDKIVIKDLLNPAELPFNKTLERMYAIVKDMHEDGITAWKQNDKIMLKDIVNRDDEVDRLHWLIERQYNMISRDVQLIEQMNIGVDEALYLFLISRILERIGDHAVIIAENILRAMKKINDAVNYISSASSSSLEVFDNSMEAWFNKDKKLANMSIEKAEEVINYCEEINNKIMQKREMPLVPINNIIYSIKRTAEYAQDIAELVINYLVNK